MDIRELRGQGVENLQNHPWEEVRAEIVGHLIKSQGKPSPGGRPLTVVDVGCGDGYLIGQLSRRLEGARFVAVDTALDAELLTLLEQRHRDFPVQFFSDPAKAAENIVEADWVLLLDVIEHIEHDRQFLKDLVGSPYIVPTTRVCITVPAFASLFCGHDVWLGHYRRYREKDLRDVCQQAGLEVLESGYFFWSLLLVRALQKLKEKVRAKAAPAPSGIVDWPYPAWMNRLFTAAFRLDFRIGRWCKRWGLGLPGLSCYAISRPFARR